MKRLLKIILIIIALGVVYSLIPVVNLYLAKDVTAPLNSEAIDKLKNNKGDYFEFIAFGDNHAGLIFNDSATLKLIKNINREDRFKKVPIDFVMVLGDATLEGSEGDYRVYNKIRPLIKWPVISAIGNHDDDEGGASRFEKYVGRKECSFSDRNSYFIIIDNSTGELTNEQFVSLEDELKKSSAYAHRFIIMHKAPLSLYQQSWYRPETNEWAYRFMKMCEKYKVDMVLSGHEHMFKGASYGGVKYVMSGGGGMLIQVPASEGGFFHYLVVRVYGDYVDYEVRKVFPPLWEFFAYYMWKESLYFLKSIVL